MPSPAEAEAPAAEPVAPALPAATLAAPAAADSIPAAAPTPTVPVPTLASPKPTTPTAVAAAPIAKRAAAPAGDDVDDIGALPPLAAGDRTAASLAAREAQIAEAKRLVRQAGNDRANGRLPTAEAAYLKALNLLPRYPLAVAGLARIHLDRHEPSEALRWAKMLIALQPNRGNNQLLLGDAYAMAGRMDDARKAWTQSKHYGNSVARARLAK
jgi:tetratricopeptide (TPR) repeat protein